MTVKINLCLNVLEHTLVMHYCWYLTCANDGGLRSCPTPLSTDWTSDGACPCSIGSDWSAYCCRFASETSMLTGGNSSGDVCAMPKFETGNALVPLKTSWFFRSPLCFTISDGWEQSWGFGLTDSLWLAREADCFGFRNVAHSWPVVISSSKLNEPSPNSKSVADLPKAKKVYMYSIIQEN